MKHTRLVENFLHLVKIDTQSRGDSDSRPSSVGQTEAISWIEGQITDIGFRCRRYDGGTLVAGIPPSHGLADGRAVAWAAHVDTAPSASGKVRPLIHEYRGGDIALPFGNVVIPAGSPSLRRAAARGGDRIITSNGTSLLGADDKAGVAALLELAHRLAAEDQHHPAVRLFFCTDEEIGRFAADLPPELMNDLRVFWTVDGTTLGTVDTGSQKQIRCVIETRGQPRQASLSRRVTMSFRGSAGHPGLSPQLWRPAHAAACDLAGLLHGSLDSAPAVAALSGNASRAVLCVGLPPSANLEGHLKRVLRRHPGVELDQIKEERVSRVTDLPYLQPMARLACRIHSSFPVETQRGPSGLGCVSFPVLRAEPASATMIVRICEVTTAGLELMRDKLEAIIAEAKAGLPRGVRFTVKKALDCEGIGPAIDARRSVLEPLFSAMREMGLQPRERCIAGGTDGGMLNLSYPDLPCPNLGTGAEMLHCEREHISEADLTQLAELLYRSTLGCGQADSDDSMRTETR